MNVHLNFYIRYKLHFRNKRLFWWGFICNLKVSFARFSEKLLVLFIWATKLSAFVKYSQRALIHLSFCMFRFWRHNCIYCFYTENIFNFYCLTHFRKVWYVICGKWFNAVKILILLFYTVKKNYYYAFTFNNFQHFYLLRNIFLKPLNLKY